MRAAFGAVPGPRADAIARVDGGLPTRRAGAQVRVPRLGAGARRGRERLTMTIGAGQPAKIGAVAETDAGDEEGHRLLLRRGGGGCCASTRYAPRTTDETRAASIFI